MSNSVPNLDVSMSNTTFLDLEKEVNERASSEFHIVIARMLDMYEERLNRIIIMNNGGNGELELLRRLYVSVKLQLRHIQRKYEFIRESDFVLNNRISNLEMQITNNRRKFYEFKRSIDPHTPDCECRGCKFLRKF